jgi:uncharacterized protein (DUF1800 family)
VESGEVTRQDRILHVLNRLAFGPRPGDFEQVSAIGPERYVQDQLHPQSIAIPGDLTDRVNQLQTLHMSPLALFLEYERPINQARKQAKAESGGDKTAIKDATKDLRIQERIVMREAVEARMMRAIEGPRQLQEVMTAFWFNHFNIFAGKGLDIIWTGAFEETAIRPHTMGKFRTILGATAHHPAMLFYLDNWQNTAPGSPGSKGKFEGINENYARELMELHTLGVNGGYSQADVIALAHILTGWGLPKPGGGGGGNRMRGDDGMAGPEMGGGMFPFMRRRRNFMGPGVPTLDPSGFYFDESRHDFSDKTFLGNHIAGGGIDEGEHALDILASRPATATHLSFKLAQYFVADDPPKALVSRMAQRYLETDGEIRAVLETMFTTAEFWDPRYFGAKFKTPYEYVISCVRATGVPVRNYRPLYGTMQVLGMPLYACQTPNGYANTADTWLNPDAMMTRLSFATALGSGNLPLENPPFEEDADGGGAMRPEPPVVPRNGSGKVNINFETGPHGPKMTPPDPVQLAATLGDYFSPATANAVEASPTQLRAPLILGSPEFMKR